MRSRAGSGRESPRSEMEEKQEGEEGNSTPNLANPKPNLDLIPNVRWRELAYTKMHPHTQENIITQRRR
eukprot:c22028_g1_i1 orf=975-1181(+)